MLKLTRILPLVAAAALAVLGPSTSFAQTYQSSFENSTDGWIAWDSASEPASVNVAGGAPAVAITDGDYALRIEANPTGAWTILTRLNHSSELLAAVQQHDTIEMDIFIEDGEILPETFSTLGFNLNHMKQNEGTPFETGGFMTTYRSFTADDTGTSVHYKWKYAAEPSFNPDTSWAQFQMISVADDPTVGSDPITEFFIDNFRFSNSLVGDFDLDDDVDSGDFLTWQRDPNVGALDEWKANFGLNVGGGISAVASAVPEPTSALLCLVGCALFVTRRRA